MPPPVGSRDLKNLPVGGMVVDVPGEGYYVMYHIPGTTVPMLWHIDRPADIASIYGPDVKFEADFVWSRQHLNNMGAVNMGVLGDIQNTEEDVLNGLTQRFQREAAYKPYLRDRSVIASIAEAAVEGREWDAGTDLVMTDYWKQRTPGQREYDLLAASDPKAAQQRMETGQQKTRELLAAAGVVDPSGLSGELALKWITGEWTEQQLIDNVRRASDPYAPGATTFQALLGGGWYGEWDDQHFLVYDGKYYGADTPEQQERLRQMYGNPAQVGNVATLGTPGAYKFGRQQLGGGWHAVWHGQHFLVQEGKYYGAVTPDEIKLLTDLAGPGQELGENLGALGTPGATTLSGFMASAERGLPGWQNPGIAGVDPTRLGGEERVRGLLQQWLGPMYAQGYSQEWIAQWAGRIRNGAEGEEDVLIAQLRATAKPLFGGREGDYESLAAPWRGFWQRYAGAAPNEQNEALFLRLVNLNDAAAGEQLLREEGRKKGWAPVAQEFLGASQQALGGQVVGAAA